MRTSPSLPHYTLITTVLTLYMIAIHGNRGNRPTSLPARKNSLKWHNKNRLSKALSLSLPSLRTEKPDHPGPGMPAGFRGVRLGGIPR